MTPDELKALEAISKGTAAGSTQSLQKLITDIFGGAAAEVGEELTEVVKRKRASWELARRVKARLEGRERRPIARNVLIPAFEFATLEDREELVNMWVELLATAGTHGRTEVDRDLVEILKNLRPLDARVLAWVANSPPELDGNDPRVTQGNQYVGLREDYKVRRASKLSVREAFSLSEEDFDLVACRLERLGLCDVARFVFPTRVGTSATGPRVYDFINLRPIAIDFVDAVSPKESE